MLQKALLKLRPSSQWVIRNGEIEWLDKTTSQPSQKEIDEMIAKIKENELIDSAKTRINLSCESAIVSGFPSSALGSEHFYQSDRDDQINLMGLVTAAKDDLLKCGVKDSDGNITWDWKPHTAAELKDVFDDGAAYKKEQLLKANTLKAQINAATTVEELDGINW